MVICRTSGWQVKRGSPNYMAPELFQQGATYSMASDMYSLGCVLYEMATGRPPFLHTSFHELLLMVLHEAPGPMPGCSASFVELVHGLLDKNPATRLSWKDMVTHPFFHFRMTPVDMPPEPVFDEYVKRHKLRPQTPSSMETEEAQERAASLRSSVNVQRLSLIVIKNIENEGDESDYQGATEVEANDVLLSHADAELDFEERRDEGVSSSADEETTSPSPRDEMATPVEAKAGNLGRVGMLEGVDPDIIRSKQSLKGTRSSASSRLGGVLSVSAGNRVDGRAGTSNGHRHNGEELSGGVQACPDALARRPELEDLIWHPTDAAVKPIVANRRIERLMEPKYDDRLLPFLPKTAKSLAEAPKEEVHAFLSDLESALKGTALTRDKLNVLSYLETMCPNTVVANVLINSGLIVTMMDMIRDTRNAALKIRLLTVVGMFVRHATYIADAVAATPILDILTEALRDKNDKVRRRSMAALGELLFYIATQSGERDSDVFAWVVPPTTTALVSRLLKAGEDQVTQHYAVKALENVASQGGRWGARFATQDVIHHLAQLFTAVRKDHSKSTSIDHMRTTCLSTISRLLRNNRQLVPAFVEKYGLRLVAPCIVETGNIKVQTVAVNILNLALCQQELSSRTRSWLTEEKNLVRILVGLLDHPVQVR
ncbi:unnamed protein product [Ostreobium quekettii]|uniref:Protein kinase domain-containing protein n=1 Tax=Ostreobium quekettii TaxID=121088 RepID=A0A8S1ILQ5_9CHLO|nr:unnamed protein product [Ostreobium quekettii]